MEGPPKHLRISADEPPSSDTGRTKAGEVPKAVAIEFAPVPPDMTTYDSFEGSSCVFAAICDVSDSGDVTCCALLIA